MLLGIWLANDVGGVQDTEVAVVLVAIVPEALPKAYDSVCVKDEDAREMLIVPALPIAVAGIDTLDVRGMVRSVTFWLALTLQPEPPLPSQVKHWKFADILTVLVPSALPAIVPLDHGAAG